MDMSEKQGETIIVVGISGVTCGGKTTTAQKLCTSLQSCKVINQDDYFLDVDNSRHKWIPELNHINWELLTSLDMEKMYNNVLNIVNNEQFIRINNDTPFEKNGNLNDFRKICNYLKGVKLKVLIVEGFSIFNYEPLLPLFNLKYYLTLTKEECLKRRSARVYNPPDPPGYFEKCVWPEHISQLEEVKTKVENVNYLSGIIDSDDITKIIIKDIFVLCNNI